MRFTDVRRWIVTLCVALLAFALTEQAFAIDGCHNAGTSLSYNVTVVVPDAPDDDAGAPAQAMPHHCGSAHVASMPAQPLGVTVHQTIVQAAWPLVAGAPDFGARAGPDRPPRTASTL